MKTSSLDRVTSEPTQPLSEFTLSNWVSGVLFSRPHLHSQINKSFLFISREIFNGVPLFIFLPLFIFKISTNKDFESPSPFIIIHHCIINRQKKDFFDEKLYSESYFVIFLVDKWIRYDKN